MNEEDIEQLTLEIANVRKVPTEKMDEIFREFYEMCLASQCSLVREE
jgi:flagellar motor switch protein FliG